MQPSVIKMMMSIWDKQYARWLINWTLIAFWREQFTWTNGNDNEWLEYYKKRIWKKQKKLFFNIFRHRRRNLAGLTILQMMRDTVRGTGVVS